MYGNSEVAAIERHAFGHDVGQGYWTYVITQVS